MTQKNVVLLGQRVMHEELYRGERDGIPKRDITALEHPARDSASHIHRQDVTQAGVDCVHALTGRGLACDLEDHFVAEQ